MRMDKANSAEGYSDIIDDLTKQIELYRKQHVTLKEEVNILITDNQHLRTQIAASWDMSNKRSTTSFGSCSETKVSLIVDNLKNQLNLSLKEKESAVDLWHNSLQIIEHLENELKLYENGFSGFIKKSEHLQIKKHYEQEIDLLNGKLSNLQVLLQNTLKSSKENLQLKGEELDGMVKKQQNTLKLVSQLEEEMKHLQAQQTNLIENNDQLERQVKKYTVSTNTLRQAHQMLKLKVDEGCQVAEAALLEKEAALTREQILKEECVGLKKTISDMMGQFGSQAKFETDLLKTTYDSKVNIMNNQIDHLTAQLKDSCVQIHISKKECQALQDQIRMMTEPAHIGDVKSMVIEDNLESTIQKLILAERKNSELRIEKSALTSDYDHKLEKLKDIIADKECENRKLDQTVKRLQSDLELSKSKLVKVGKKVTEMNSRLKFMESEVKRESTMKEASKMKLILEEVDNEHQKTFADLMTQLKAQIEINKCWRTEVPQLTEKLNRRHAELKTEILELTKTNRKLNDELTSARGNLGEYEKHMQHLSKCFETLNENLAD